MTLLLTLPTFSGDAPMAEKLLDWIFQLRGRRQSGSCLVVCYGDTHEEMRIKLSIAAEVAFEHTEMVIAPEIPSQSKTDRVGHVFKFAAEHIARNYRVPWLWLEPDSVPLKTDWLEQLSLAFQSQPKLFFGPHIQTADKKIYLRRNSVYAPNILPQFTTQSGDLMTPASTKTRLIQQIFYKPETDLEKIRPDAVLMHSDKSGQLINHLREKL